MSSTEKPVYDSSEYWAQAAKHDKLQYRMSLACAGLGVMAVGAGAVVAIGGDVVSGSSLAAMGGLTSGIYLKEGFEEIEDYATAKTIHSIAQNKPN